MRHSLHSHILYLETTIQNVRERLTKPHLSAEEVEDLQLQLTLAESALEHYRQAYALELSVSGPQPPGWPAGKSIGDTWVEKDLKDKEKKGGLAIVARGRVSKKFHGRVPYPFASRGGRMCA